jgi:hypothetical protein
MSRTLAENSRWNERRCRGAGTYDMWGSQVFT